MNSTGRNTIRIGGACGYWGESPHATAQLLADGNLDYIVYDYLAEITLSIMARARMRDPEKGYATDFVSQVLAPNLQEIAAQGVRIISNAGGMNPASCAAAVQQLIRDEGLSLTVAVITGDDLMPERDALAAAAPPEMFSDQAFPDPERIASINAYLGAFPIAAALGQGADIVITGRCVDSAVTLGALIHEFGWASDQYEKLAGGSLAGHIIECGPQATGGNFTDWRLAADGIDDIGYPIAEVTSDATFVVTKPGGTAGLVSVATVTEQLVYEIGDPQAYELPDVICDFSNVAVRQLGENRVQVSGATGRRPSGFYKTSLTWADGFRGGSYLTFYGSEAAAKARAYTDAALARSRRTLATLGLPEFVETSVELLGTESQFGASARAMGCREVVAKIAARHESQAGVSALLRVVAGLGLSGPPGLSGFTGLAGRPSPVVRLFSFLIDMNSVTIDISIDDQSVPFEPVVPAAGAELAPTRPQLASPGVSSETVKIKLRELAWGRSGDKGNKANIGIVARHPELLPVIWAALDTSFVVACFGHFIDDPAPETCITRFLMPGPQAMNIVIDRVLGGGGVASLRNDAQGKGYAQLLLEQEIDVPVALKPTTSGAS